MGGAIGACLAMTDQQDMQAVFQSIWNAAIEMMVGLFAARLGRNPAQTPGDTIHVRIYRKAVSAQTKK